MAELMLRAAVLMLRAAVLMLRAVVAVFDFTSFGPVLMSRAAVLISGPLLKETSRPMRTGIAKQGIR
eukprot:9373005-Lingulodinium_polyedra.AAC.1